jgi:DHA2 family methylenomycin A resistance protein-like MFS transporter
VAVVSAGLFLSVISTTVVSVALPSIGSGLHAGPADLEWIVDAYVLVYATLLITGGVLGDWYGRKGLFLIGVGLFGAGSLLTGLAPAVPVLLAGRVVQGLGPALMVPGSLAFIRAIFDDERARALAIGLWSTSAGLAMALGPALGGLLIDAGGWRWVFLFNGPLALVVALAAARMVPRLPRVRHEGGFDWAGAVLSTAGVALLVLALIDGQAVSWTAPIVLIGAIAGLAALAGFVVWELRRRQPMIDVRLFARPAFTAANVAAFTVFFAFIGLIVYLSGYFQNVQGRSPVATGLAISLLGVALAVSSAATGALVGRTGERLPMIAGLVLSGAATLVLVTIGPGTGLGSLWWPFLLLGVGMGLSGTVTTTIAMSAVNPERAGMASAIVNALRQVGQVFGVAVLGALVYGQLPGGGTVSGRLSPHLGALFVSGLRSALWVSGLALLAVAALATALTVSRRRTEPAAVPDDGPDDGPGADAGARPSREKVHTG